MSGGGGWSDGASGVNGFHAFAECFFLTFILPAEHSQSSALPFCVFPAVPPCSPACCPAGLQLKSPADGFGCWRVPGDASTAWLGSTLHCLTRCMQQQGEHQKKQQQREHEEEQDHQLEQQDQNQEETQPVFASRHESGGDGDGTEKDASAQEGGLPAGETAHLEPLSSAAQGSSGGGERGPQGPAGRGISREVEAGHPNAAKEGRSRDVSHREQTAMEEEQGRETNGDGEHRVSLKRAVILAGSDDDEGDGTLFHVQRSMKKGRKGAGSILGEESDEES